MAQDLKNLINEVKSQLTTTRPRFEGNVMKVTIALFDLIRARSKITGYPVRILESEVSDPWIFRIEEQMDVIDGNPLLVIRVQDGEEEVTDAAPRVSLFIPMSIIEADDAMKAARISAHKLHIAGIRERLAEHDIARETLVAQLDAATKDLAYEQE